jgi:hypothetical protein
MNRSVYLVESETPGVLSNETLSGHTLRRGAHGRATCGPCVRQNAKELVCHAGPMTRPN